MNLIILVCQLASCPPDLDQAILGIPDGYCEKLQEGTWISALLASQIAFPTTHEFHHFMCQLASCPLHVAQSMLGIPDVRGERSDHT